jgi:hypothetical protein
MDDNTRAASVVPRVTRAFLLVVSVAVAAVLTSAQPASAHGGGITASNYETRLLHVSTPVPGLRVRVIDLGNRIELTNHNRHDVVVVGYDREPYLRIGPRGVFENLRSSAVYLNKTRLGTTHVPASANPRAKPEWRRTDTGQTARWHDHRIHWMGLDDPPIVQRDRNAPHLIQGWRINLRWAGTRVHVDGDLRWIPGPSPWPLLLGALVLAGVFGVLSRTRRWARALGIGLVMLTAAGVLHVAGLWSVATGSSLSHLAVNAYLLGGLAIAVIALVVFVRRGADHAAPIALIGGVFLLLAGGLADVTSLSHSQVPTTIAPWLDRLAIAFVIGVGAGVSAVAAFHLPKAPPRRGARPRRTGSRGTPAPPSRAGSQSASPEAP